MTFLNAWMWRLILFDVNNSLKILMLTPNFNILCGRSKSVFNTAISLQDLGYNVIIGTNGGNDIQKLIKNNLNLIILKNYSEGINIFSFLKSIFELKKILSDNSYDIIHSHHRFFELVINIVNLFFYKSSIKTVFTAHNIYSKNRFFQFKSNKIIAVSNFVKENLINQCNVDRNNIIVIYNFLLQGEINKLTEITKQAKNGNILLLSTGRFDESKNFVTLLNALKIYNNKNISLIIIGEGAKENELWDIIHKNQLNAKIIKPVKNFYDYIAKADICISTSINDGMGYFVLESIIANKLILVSNIGGHIELLERYNKFMVFEPYSSVSLSEKIELLYKNNFIYNECHDNFLNEKFTRYYNLNLILKVYGVNEN